MRVLVAGATGAIGRALVPVLSAAGHDVVAQSRQPSTAFDGVPGKVEAVQADALDPVAVERLVRRCARTPSSTCSPPFPIRSIRATWPVTSSMTNRLRPRTAPPPSTCLRGARSCLRANEVIDPAAAAADEETVWEHPPKQFGPNLEALRMLERLTVSAGGTVLRLGHLYGPGTIYAADGSFTRQVQTGKAPMVGGGTSVFSFSHVHDVAASGASTERPKPGEPVRSRMVGLKPMHVWDPLSRDLAPLVGVSSGVRGSTQCEWATAGFESEEAACALCHWRFEPEATPTSTVQFRQTAKQLTCANTSAPPSQQSVGADVSGHFVDTGSKPTGPDLCVSAGQGLYLVAGAGFEPATSGSNRDACRRLPIRPEPSRFTLNGAGFSRSDSADYNPLTLPRARPNLDSKWTPDQVSNNHASCSTSGLSDGTRHSHADEPSPVTEPGRGPCAARTGTTRQVWGRQRPNRRTHRSGRAHPRWHPL